MARCRAPSDTLVRRPANLHVVRGAECHAEAFCERVQVRRGLSSVLLSPCVRVAFRARRSEHDAYRTREPRSLVARFVEGGAAGQRNAKAAVALDLGLAEQAQAGVRFTQRV